MIEITQEMKNAHAQRIASVEARVDKRITMALEDGRNITYFPCDKDSDADVYAEIRAKYERAGYRIIPTGYIGGVWQLTEDICW